MIYFLRLLFILINIDQETVLNWFGVKNEISSDYLFHTFDNEGKPSTVLDINVKPGPAFSIETFKLVIEGLWFRVHDGLTLSDIENILFFIIFLRFIILAIRYNLKTSLYITSIGLFAGYLWYRHLIDLLSLYKSILIQLPYLHKLGADAVQLQATSRQLNMTDLKLSEKIHWYNPGQLLYYAFQRGIIHTDLNTGLKYFVDPISMYVSNLEITEQKRILPIYYKVYTQIIPRLYQSATKFWSQISGMVAYSVMTRIGKKYCPYLVRWHWTFLLIIVFLEQIFIYFVFRVSYFQSVILMPQVEEIESIPTNTEINLLFNINFLNGLTAIIISVHLALVILGLFHAIWGQYFYVPFFVENTELHIGPRPKTSVYSGGYTAWQDEKKKNINRFLPKIWYGWFGRGTDDNSYFFKPVVKVAKRLYKVFRRSLKF